MKPVLLVVPGLGDQSKPALLLHWWIKRWKKYEVVVFQSNWSSSESYQDKFTRLRSTLIENKNSNRNVIIVGYSAGSPLALRLVNEDSEVTAFMSVSGKNSGYETIGKAFQKRAVALLESVQASQEILQNTPQKIAAKTVVFRPLRDFLIPMGDMLIPGAKKVRVIAFGHTLGIAIAILFYLPKYIRRVSS
jgi:pimeloyl-ACP methyl ester carboxylesterase